MDWHCDPLPRPGNLHEIKSHAYYVGGARDGWSVTEMVDRSEKW